PAGVANLLPGAVDVGHGHQRNPVGAEVLLIDLGDSADGVVAPAELPVGAADSPERPAEELRIEAARAVQVVSEQVMPDDLAGEVLEARAERGEGKGGAGDEGGEHGDERKGAEMPAHSRLPCNEGTAAARCLDTPGGR